MAVSPNKTERRLWGGFPPWQGGWENLGKDGCGSKEGRHWWLRLDGCGVRSLQSPFLHTPNPSALHRIPRAKFLTPVFPPRPGKAWEVAQRHLGWGWCLTWCFSMHVNMEIIQGTRAPFHEESTFPTKSCCLILFPWYQYTRSISCLTQWIQGRR